MTEDLVQVFGVISEKKGDWLHGALKKLLSLDVTTWKQSVYITFIFEKARIIEVINHDFKKFYTSSNRKAIKVATLKSKFTKQKFVLKTPTFLNMVVKYAHLFRNIVHAKTSLACP